MPAPPRTRRLAGWGRVPVVQAVELVGEDLPALGTHAAIARGAGRSYGDASLPAPGDVALGTRLANRLLAFDTGRGVLRVEAGLRLDALLRVAHRQGWTCPVVPGTRHVSLGGMIAADVHGKNHHVAGTIGAHVRALLLQRADGRVVLLRPEDDAEVAPRDATAITPTELFWATIGGMGWTGHVLEVELQLARLPSPWIAERRVPFGSLDEGLERLAAASAAHPFTAAWIDGTATGRALGRGVLVHGDWAPAPPGASARTGAARPRRVRLDAPLVGDATIRLFNALHRARHRAPRARIVPFETFAWPLDALDDWPRLYGPRGFVQHQSVVPDGAGVRALLEVLARRGRAPALAVLKDCGAQGRGHLSFPRRGLSLALDLPMRGLATQAHVDALDEQVLAHGGRVYLAKDALSRGATLRAMDPRLDAFAARKPAWDPERRLRSALFVRLFGDAA